MGFFSDLKEDLAQATGIVIKIRKKRMINALITLTRFLLLFCIEVSSINQLKY